MGALLSKMPQVFTLDARTSFAAKISPLIDFVERDTTNQANTMA
jgi:hypothetical protein